MNLPLEGLTYIGIVFRPIYVVIILFGFWAGLSRTRLSPSERKKFFLSVSIPLIAWLIAIWILSSRGAFMSGPGRGNPLLPIAIFSPLIIWIAAFNRSTVLDEVLEVIPSWWLIGIQVYRVLGLAFLAQLVLGRISPAFALPAGIGDVLTGVLAPFAALAVARSGNIAAGLTWNALGVFDLFLAVVMGILNGAGFLPPPAVPGAPPLGAYPLVMIPAYTVPLSLVLHYLSIRQLRRRRSGEEQASAPKRTASVDIG